MSRPRALRGSIYALGCLLALLGAHGAQAKSASPAVSAPAGHSATRSAGTRHIDWVGNGGPADSSIGDRSVSYSSWGLSGDTFIVRYLLPISDAERVAGTNIEVLVQQRLGSYLLAHLAVRAGSQDCPAIDQGYDIGKVDPLTVAAGLYGFEIFFRCPTGTAGNVVLENRALFDRIRGHVDFARVQVKGGAFGLQLFTGQHQQLILPARPASLTRYAGLGLGNVLGSPDRLCFLLGTVLLILTRVRAVPLRTESLQSVPLQLRAWVAALLYVIAGLAVGYGLSLLASLGGGLAPRERLLDAAIGLLVALVAARIATRELVRMRTAVAATTGVLACLALLVWISHGHWPALLLLGGAAFAGSQLAAGQQLERRVLGWLLLPALFGFLDGFVLPAEVVPMQLPGHAILPMALGFDCGALLTEVAVLVALSLAIAAVRAWPRTRSLLTYSGLSTDLATTALAGAGVFWMLSRLHG